MADQPEEQPKYIFVVTEDGNEVLTEASSTQFVLGQDEENLVTNFENSGEINENIWTMCDNALTELLKFLLCKHNFTNLANVKPTTWEDILNEINSQCGFIGMVSIEDIKSKTQELTTTNSNFKNDILPSQVVLERCENLTQKLFDLYVNEDSAKKEPENESKLKNIPQQQSTVDFKSPISRLAKLKNQRNFIYGSNPSYSMLTTKKLEHQIKLEMLNYDREKWKIKVENQELFKEKLKKQNDLASINLDKAKIELEILQSGIKQ